MIGHFNRGALIALTVLSLSASNARAACCGLWNSWFAPAPAPVTTYYAPFTASYAPAGYGQTVNYMPQTCYRTVYVNAPVVAYRPMSACDPCTGCATTVMRPVVSYVTQARLVPYTTYRPVVAAAPACCGAVTAAYAAPIAVTAPVAAPAPCCGASPAPALPPMGAPGTTVPSLAPTLNYPPVQAPPPAAPYPRPATAPPAGILQPITPPAGALQPSPDPNPKTDVPPPGKTFDNPQESNKPAPESRLLLPPRSETLSPSSNGPLRGLDPDDQDRVTTVPTRQAWAVRPASVISLRSPVVEKQIDIQWRAARP
jgi:hypothetical protein